MSNWGPIICGNGKIAAGYVEPCLLAVVDADSITDEEWMDYMVRSTDHSGVGGVKVSAIRFTRTSINATQRHLTNEYIDRLKLPPTAFTVVFAGNDLVRGALIAFSWLLRKWNLAGYAPDQYEKAFKELNKHAPFDVDAANVMWKRLHELLNVPL